MKSIKIEKILLLLILAIAAFLILKNLDQMKLWGDEAETAVIARNILKFGYPSPWDGKNLVTQQFGNDIVKIGGKFLWAWHPWLSHYLTAIFFALFGQSTFVARLPFALMGLASIFILYLLVKRFFASEKIALLSSFLLTTCVPFLLYVRQCRYYMPVLFFGLLVLYFYLKFIKEGKGLFWLVVSAILLFHSNFLASFALLAPLLIFFFLYDFSKQRLKSILVALFFFLIFTLPWLFYFYTASQAPILPRLFLRNLYLYLAQFNYVFPLIFLPFLYFIWKDTKAKFKLKREISLILIIIVGSWLLMSLFMAREDAYFSIRYITYLYPLLAILLALIIGWIWQKIKIVAFLVTFLLIFTNFFSLGYFVLLNPALKAFHKNPKEIVAHFYLKDYWYEINHNYFGPIAGIIEFLNKNAKEGDTLITNYDQEPITFYTKIKIINRVKDPQNPAYYLTYDPQPPTWILPRGAGQNTVEIPAGFKKFEIPYPDLPWENLPEMDYHKFKTVKDYPFVTIYKKNF